MANIDDKTLVPLSWLMGGFAVGLIPVITATFWIASVNYRLQRIEAHLGITSPENVASSNGWGSALADPK